MKSRTPHLVGLLSTVFAAAIFAADPVVEHVRISQRAGTKLVDIEYRVTDADGDAMTITVSGRDIQNSVDVAINTLSGDGANGATVTSGVHHLTWDAGADWTGNLSDDFRITIRATDTGGGGPAPPDMALIPAGSFQMGNNLGDGSSNETPVHAVHVSAFYMGTTEVTNEQVREVFQWAHNNGKVTATSSTVQNAPGNQQELLDLDSSHCQISFSGSTFSVTPGKGNYPCVEISWYGAVAYCNYRSEMAGLPACYDLSDWSCSWSAGGYRLPTEAEWEKGARGGLNGERFAWGATITHQQANYCSYWEDGAPYYFYDDNPVSGYHPSYDDGDFPYTSPVGRFLANNYGLLDMAGNAWEWCGDWYATAWYENADASENDPVGPGTGLSRVLRGGSWYSYASSCRAAGRYYSVPGNGYMSVGFRLVLPAGQQ